MQYGQFVKEVAERAELDREAAATAVEATLVTLAQRLTPEEAQDMIAQLPDELKVRVRPPLAASPMGVGEFIERVAEAEGVGDAAIAREHARAVLLTLQVALSAGEANDVLDQLPAEYEPLLT
jgi:uncharacterized protein (DUF2267 family)